MLPWASRCARATAAQRALPDGALVLGALGTYVTERPAGLVIGNRPGRFHVGVGAVCVPIGLVAGWLLWPLQPWAGAMFLLLSGVAPLLTLLTTQRWEVEPDVQRARGWALGIRRDHAWPLPADPAVRVDRRQEWDVDSATQWPCYQVQVRTSAGWLGVAESGRAEVAQMFARRLAAAARVPLLEEAPPPAPQ